MKTSERTWRITIAALLVLAVIFVWPPDDPGSFSPNGHQLPSLHHRHEAAETWNGPHGVQHVDLDADCDASRIGCCVMTQCHPGIAIDPQDMTVFAADDETIAAAAVGGLGSGPGVVLPPPRRLPV